MKCLKFKRNQPVEVVFDDGTVRVGVVYCVWPTKHQQYAVAFEDCSAKRCVESELREVTVQ